MNNDLNTLAVLAPNTSFEGLAAAAIWGLAPADPHVAERLAALVAGGQLQVAPNPLWQPDGQYGNTDASAAIYQFTEGVVANLPQPEFDTCLRHAQYFETVNRGANYRQMQADPAPEYGMTLIQQSWPNIVKAHAWCVQQIEHPSAATLVDDFVAYGFHLLPELLGPTGYGQWLQNGLTAAEMLHRFASTMYHHLNLGELALAANNLTHAEEHFTTALALAEQIEDPPAAAQALEGLGLMAFAANQPAVARNHLQAALEIAQQLDDAEGIAEISANLANLPPVD